MCPTPWAQTCEWVFGRLSERRHCNQAGQGLGFRVYGLSVNVLYTHAAALLLVCVQVCMGLYS